MIKRSYAFLHKFLQQNLAETIDDERVLICKQEPNLLSLMIILLLLGGDKGMPTQNVM